VRGVGGSLAAAAASQASFLSVTDAQGAPLFPRLDFVGTLERFAEDWATLEQLLRGRPLAPPLPLRPHRDGDRAVHRNPTPSGLSALLKATLVNDTKLLKMVRRRGGGRGGAFSLPLAAFLFNFVSLNLCIFHFELSGLFLWFLSRFCWQCPLK
jgi:hypothetical protein